jgi:hypothetical protein
MTRTTAIRHSSATAPLLKALLALSLSCLALPAAQAAQVFYPPSLKATANAAPPASAPVKGDLTCTALGNWFTETRSGDGSWTKTTTKLTCKAKGTWTDAFSYTWVLTKNHKDLSGTVTYHGIGCAADTWPVAGTVTSKTTFTVTATNPVAGDPGCEHTFGYNLTIQ